MNKHIMAEELLSLKWNNHQTHFVDILSILREHEIFIDVTIACGGKLYSAHKFVLSTCSEYFKQMFIKNPNKHPIIFMKDVSARDIEALMDFMYNGEVNVPQSTLGSLIKTAESLQIKGLAVPDDPPLKKDRDISNTEKRRINSNSSPPPKRLKQRETNDHPKHNTQIKSKSPNRPEENVDEDSNSLHSGISELSTELKSNWKNVNENINYLGKLSTNCIGDPLAGPSGIEKAKEELEIKQEDSNAVDEEDDGVAWNQESDSRGEEDRGDGSANSDNSNLFTDHLLAGNDSSSLSVSTDSAMISGCSSRDSINCYQSVAAANREVYNNSRRSSSYPQGSSNMCTTSRNNLIALMEPKPFYCAICNRRFKLKQTLKQHMRLHTGEKPYICRYCDARFVQLTMLKRHSRTLHLNESSLRIYN